MTVLPLTASLLALALVPVGLVACGGGDSTASNEGKDSAQRGQDALRQFGSPATAAQSRQAEATVRGFLGARAAGKWQRACSYIAQATRRLDARLAARSEQVPGSSCASWIENSAGQVPASDLAALAEIDVDSVRVDGDNGYVFYVDPDEERVVSIRSEGGDWKLTSLIGAPLEAS